MIREFTTRVKAQVEAHKKILKQIQGMQAELGRMRRERYDWMRYEEERDRVIRTAWRQHNARLLKDLPSFPTQRASDQAAASPSHHE